MTRGAIGFLLHPDEGDGVIAAAQEVAARHGYRTWTTMVRPADDLAEHARGTRLLVTVGGDGTFLFGARLAAPRGIPVLGVNRGRLGFLTDLELDRLASVIEAFAEGRTVSQRRGMLAAEIFRDSLADSSGDQPPPVAGQPLEGLALNDVVLKSPEVAVIRLRVEADGELLGEFDADGVVVATATGSTGYALSAGSPPVDPRVPAILVVPLAPHAVITRPVVLPDSTVVELGVEHGRVLVAADGQHLADLHPGARVRISPGPALMVVRHAGSPSFLRQLRDKVRFGLPLKPAERDSSGADRVPLPGGGTDHASAAAHAPGADR
ncbi:MAG TPA: NAD(+)/NADH kinase [Candidatus Binatia bacterium]|nr:NAD(+)/NADH kinase [Candidatus Binatia bacterium]